MSDTLVRASSPARLHTHAGEMETNETHELQLTEHARRRAVYGCDCPIVVVKVFSRPSHTIEGG